MHSNSKTKPTRDGCCEAHSRSHRRDSVLPRYLRRDKVRIRGVSTGNREDDLTDGLDSEQIMSLSSSESSKSDVTVAIPSTQKSSVLSSVESKCNPPISSCRCTERAGNHARQVLRSGPDFLLPPELFGCYLEPKEEEIHRRFLLWQ